MTYKQYIKLVTQLNIYDLFIFYQVIYMQWQVLDYIFNKFWLWFITFVHEPTCFFYGEQIVLDI